jgi:dienelactone hydrolase
VSEIVVFPSVLGMRPAVRDAARRLEAAGHSVHVIDLYGDGRSFDTYSAGFAHVAEIGGFPELITRTEAGVAQMPAEPVYLGFSTGGSSAEYLALTRPGAKAVLLLHASMSIEEFGATAWPAHVPVQVHYAQHDQFRDQHAADALAASVRAAGGDYEFYEYPITAHLFTDPGLAEEYDPTSTNLLYARALQFLAQSTLDTRRAIQSP